MYLHPRWPTRFLVAQKASRKYLTRMSPKWPKYFSFFLSSSSSSDKLVQNCVILSQRFLHKTAAFYTEQCTSPSLFDNFKVSRGTLTSHSRTMASSAMPFSLLVQNLAMKLSHTQVTWRHGELSGFVNPLDWVLESVMIQPILLTSTEEDCDDRLFAVLW